MYVLSGLIAVSNLDEDVKVPAFRGTAQNCKITYVDDETSLVHELVKCVRKWDPDILGGYEVIQLKVIYIIFSIVTYFPSKNFVCMVTVTRIVSMYIVQLSICFESSFEPLPSLKSMKWCS
jgi:hypothetical protein